MKILLHLLHTYIHTLTFVTHRGRQRSWTSTLYPPDKSHSPSQLASVSSYNHACLFLVLFPIFNQHSLYKFVLSIYWHVDVFGTWPNHRNISVSSVWSLITSTSSFIPQRSPTTLSACTRTKCKDYKDVRSASRNLISSQCYFAAPLACSLPSFKFELRS